MQLVYAFGVFLLASMAYAAFEWTGSNSFFLAQAAVIPARFALGILDAVLPLSLDLRWLDVDARGTGARLGRSVAFGATALLVYVPARLHRLRPTRLRKALAIAPWLLIAFALGAFLLLLIGIESSWSN